MSLFRFDYPKGANEAKVALCFCFLKNKNRQIFSVGELQKICDNFNSKKLPLTLKLSHIDLYMKEDDCLFEMKDSYVMKKSSTTEDMLYEGLSQLSIDLLECLKEEFSD